MVIQKDEKKARQDLEIVKIDIRQNGFLTYRNFAKSIIDDGNLIWRACDKDKITTAAYNTDSLP